MTDNKQTSDMQNLSGYRNEFKEYLDRLQRESEESGIPGPAVYPHPDNYKGHCNCWDCLKKSWKKK